MRINGDDNRSKAKIALYAQNGILYAQNGILYAQNGIFLDVDFINNFDIDWSSKWLQAIILGVNEF